MGKMTSVKTVGIAVAGLLVLFLSVTLTSCITQQDKGAVYLKGIKAAVTDLRVFSTILHDSNYISDKHYVEIAKGNVQILTAAVPISLAVDLGSSVPCLDTVIDPTPDGECNPQDLDAWLAAQQKRLNEAKK